MFQALRRLAPRFAGSGNVRSRWAKAQDGEFEWWRRVSGEGFEGQDPEKFITEVQRDWLLSQLAYLEKPPGYWSDKTVVEFGSGPAGFVEYIDAARKIAVEPLIDRYRAEFPHLSKSKVEYFGQPAELPAGVPSQIADLVICFNVLDHTYDPKKVVAQMSRVAKPGADLLFQVNVYKTQAEIDAKHGLHAELHPHSFFPETVRALLTAGDFTILKEICAEVPNPSGEYYFLCTGRKN